MSEIANDLDLAAQVANGSWTYLGGAGEKHYGLYLGEELAEGGLRPRWHHMMQADIDHLIRSLESAMEVVDRFVWACRTADMADISDDKGEQDTHPNRP